MMRCAATASLTFPSGDQSRSVLSLISSPPFDPLASSCRDRPSSAGTYELLIPPGEGDLPVLVLARRQAELNGEMASAWTLRNLDYAGYGTVSPDKLYLRDANMTVSVAGTS